MVIPRTGNQYLMKVKSHLGNLGDLRDLGEIQNNNNNNNKKENLNNGFKDIYGLWIRNEFVKIELKNVN